MKTTKMIAAVLAVFLALALFAGAASAVPAADSTVYVYQYGATGDSVPTTYYLFEAGYVAGSVLTDATGTFVGDNIKEGLYGNTTNFTTSTLFTLKYPALTLKGVLNKTSTSIEGKALLPSQSIDFTVSGVNTTSLPYKLVFYSSVGGSTSIFNGSSYTSITSSQVNGVTIGNEPSGDWSVKASLLTGSVVNRMASGTPSKYLDSAKISFKIGTTYTDSIAVSKESIIRGSSLLLTVTGDPNEYVVVNVTDGGFKNFEGQSGISNISNATTGYLNGFVLLMNEFGTRTVQLDTNASSKDDSYTFTAKLSPDKTVKVTIKKGEVTAQSEQDSYYIGNSIKLSGTNTESPDVFFFVKGANKKLTYLDKTSVQSDKTWSKTLSSIANLDAGTYTFYASAQNLTGVSGVNLSFNDDTDTYVSLSLALKQPFLTATAESAVVAQKDDIIITGTGEAASELRYYVFGTNLFKEGTITPEEDGSYSQKIKTTDYDAGQYFVVIQHPMYDGKFNIGPVPVNAVAGNYDIKIQENTTVGDFKVNGTTLFNTLTRQSANAAEALCQALDSQNIDDIYVKLTFIVATPTLTMNPVSDVTKGSALKVSGTTNINAGKTVTVDVLSTAFTAVEKTAVGSASFITLTTKVVKGADGVNTWEVTFDTTGLNVDTYTIQAATESLKTSAIVKVLEAAPTATATATATKTATATATATATPTKTPGFGAFLALAGLGAVAVLVLRRD